MCYSIKSIYFTHFQIRFEEDGKDVEKNISLKLPHIIIIFNDNSLLEKIIEKNIPIDIWMAEVLVEPKTAKCIDNIENYWIDNANCFHLAAKFNPKGLHLLLTKLKAASSIEFDNLYEGDKVSPLHVAALNSNSISLR